MPTATEILRREHDAIRRMLDVAEELAHRLRQDESVAPEMLGELNEFFQLFADRCHHAKEEELLFPLLEQKGIPRAGGPIGVMLAEHEEGRALVRGMVESADAYGRGEKTAGRRWAEAARQYSDLLSQHILKENNVLFGMAERVLSPADQTRLADNFERLETEKMGVGTHERLHRVMDRLAAQVLAAPEQK
jgi:hemerythrin-like domain-containing protein